VKNFIPDYVKYVDLNFLVPLKGSLVPNRLNNIANSIAQHIANVSFEKTIPTRMILNLKIDPHDRVWLLWCSSLRSDKKAVKPPRPLTPPKGIAGKNLTVHQEPMKIELKPKLPGNIRSGVKTNV
jgi:hypothetical protein